MTTVRHEIRIEAPIEAVWKAVADLEAVQRYNPMVATTRVISANREGIGASRRCELKPKGWVEERVWEWNPPRSIGMEISASPWPLVFMRWRTELQPEGKATRISQETSYRLKFGPVGVLMDALVMRRKLNQGIAEVFVELKRFVESRPG